MASARKQPGKILDLFAGAGGWEEGLSMLGLSALGIETEPWACETARAAGHERLQADVTALDPLQFSPVWGLIGSPPCQAYSTAGKGLGRADKPLVVACAHELAAGNDSRAARLKECRDPRSLLTVEPLRFALALKPRWVALEQVPAVLELWTLLAALLSEDGYQAAVGVLSAERYGVPQTRKRAFLIASLDGPVSLPDSTHRSYNPRRQETPEDELLLEPWVSMAEALGWTPSEEVGFPRRNDTPSNHPSKADTGTYRKRDRRPACKPALTLTAKTRSWTRKPCRDGWAWRNGNQRNAAIRAAEEPAPTVHFGRALNQVEWVPTWAGRRPATTVACDRRVHPPGHKQNASDPPGRYEQRRGANAVRVTVCQAAVLQGFPADYPWRGTRTRQFEQVGNAVPPPVAHRVLEQAIQPSQDDQPSADRKESPVSTRSSGSCGVRAQDPEEVVALARAEHEPVAVWCLFSGGNDSTVLAHRCREHYQGLVWIDTGTAVPGVAEFVREYAEWIGKPLRVMRAGDAYRQMVLGDFVWWARFIAAHDREPGLSIEAFVARDEREHGRASGGELGQLPHGFPGPGAHGRAYNRLKERQIMALLRESKVGHPRRARVLFLSGIRRAESRRRSKREAISRLPGKAAVFASPLIDWSNQEVRGYRHEHGIPESPAAALLHRSGECNCGAFADANGEREMLKALYPDWFAGIEALETEARAAGVRWCRWGGYDIDGNRAGGVSRQKPGLLCESCESRQHQAITDRRRKPRRRAVGCASRGDAE